ncbi:MAG: nucleotidyltransferase family protein [Thermoplasmata archaeon]
MNEVEGVAALLLSGGASSRFDGRPKALLPVGSRPAIRRMAEIALDEELFPVIAVAGAHAEAVLQAVRGLPVSVVGAERWREGRTASIQAGLAVIPPEHDVLLWPVDHPFVEPATVLELLRARANDALGSWFLPTWGGHGGHPVLIRRSVFPAIRSLAPDAPLRNLLPELGPQVVRVPVDDPGVFANVDTLERYVAAHQEWRERSERRWIEG